MPTVTILSLGQSVDTSVTAQVVQPHGPPTGSELSRSQFASLLAAIKDSINDSPISKRISKGHKRRLRRRRQSASDMKSLTTIRRRPMKSKQRSTPKSRTR